VSGTGGSTTRGTRLSRARGASTQKRTAGTVTPRTEDAGGQWRTISGNSGSMGISENNWEKIVGVTLVVLYLIFLMGGV
jgi:hypothetical protein